jgi:hypothetical protein
MRRECCAALAAVTLLAVAARADIYEWRDASGARHFTNSKQAVPDEYQAVVRTLVADWERPAPVESVPAPQAPAAQPEVVSDIAGLTEAYVAGMRAALDLGGGGGGGGGGVQINGPLAVASVRNSDVTDGYPGAFYPPWPWYYPFVTTSFDRGRSRHQTLRMLLQDQFQLDRDGPYAYDRWNQPGLGPALAPFLPRGLPYGVLQYGRVIHR